MDKLEDYRQIIREVLSQYVNIDYANVDAKNKTAFDTKSDQYMVVSVGWSKDKRRVHGCLIHVEIMDGLVWVQRDGTEYGVTDKLVKAGIPKSRIVLGFHEPSVRPLTGFAFASPIA